MPTALEGKVITTGPPGNPSMNFTVLLSCRGFCVVHVHWVNLDEAIPLCFGGRSHRKGKMRV